MFRSAIAAGCLLFSMATAQAQASSAFSLSVTGPEPAMPTLLSDSDGLAVFTLGGDYDRYSNAYTSMGYATTTSRWFDVAIRPLSFSVADGYSITGISLTGIVDGYVTGQNPPGTVAAGGAFFALSAAVSSGELSARDSISSSGPLTEAFDASLDNLDLRGSFLANTGFTLGMHNSDAIVRRCVNWGPDGGCLNYYDFIELPFSVGARLGDVRLNVSYAAIAAPVPEPEVYLMMLAGLGAVGFARRRATHSPRPPATT